MNQGINLLAICGMSLQKKLQLEANLLAQFTDSLFSPSKYHLNLNNEQLTTEKHRNLFHNNEFQNLIR